MEFWTSPFGSFLVNLLAAGTVGTADGLRGLYRTRRKTSEFRDELRQALHRRGFVLAESDVDSWLDTLSPDEWRSLQASDPAGRDLSVDSFQRAVGSNLSRERAAEATALIAVTLLRSSESDMRTAMRQALVEQRLDEILQGVERTNEDLPAVMELILTELYKLQMQWESTLDDRRQPNRIGEHDSGNLSPTILVVDDREAPVIMDQLSDYRCYLATELGEAIRIIKDPEVILDGAVIDMRLSESGREGIEVIDALRTYQEDAEYVIVSQYPVHEGGDERRKQFFDNWRPFDILAKGLPGTPVPDLRPTILRMLAADDEQMVERVRSQIKRLATTQRRKVRLATMDANRLLAKGDLESDEVARREQERETVDALEREAYRALDNADAEEARAIRHQVSRLLMEAVSDAPVAGDSFGRSDR